MRQVWSADELEHGWSLTLDDRRSVGSKRGPARLRFAVLSKYFELEARFPENPGEVPVEAVVYVAEQVGVDWRVFESYRWRGRTIEMHRSQIRAPFGFRPATDDDAELGGKRRYQCTASKITSGGNRNPVNAERGTTTERPRRRDLTTPGSPAAIGRRQLNNAAAHGGAALT